MQLEPRQLSSLAEMGIAVWELRQPSSPSIETDNSEPLSESTNEQLARCDWWVLVEQQQNQQTQRLLHVMLSAIGLAQHDVALVTQQQLSQLQQLSCEQKVLLVLDDQAIPFLLGKQVSLADCREKTHQTLTAQINTVFSFSLTELLQSPENKALAWQDLKLAKASYQQLGSK